LNREVEKQLARKAVQIQDACNPIAVAGHLHQTFLALSREGLDHQAVSSHPITIAVLDKLVSLCDYSTDAALDAHSLCDTLSED
jgi:hypothetical protein